VNMIQRRINAHTAVPVWGWYISYNHLADPYILDIKNPKEYAMAVWRDLINRPKELQ